MASIGYARVSSTDQDFDSQVDRLKAAGCSKIFSEKKSGKSTNGRPELDSNGQAGAGIRLRGGHDLAGSAAIQLGRVLINAGSGRMSALGANRTCRDGGNDVNDPKRT